MHTVSLTHTHRHTDTHTHTSYPGPWTLYFTITYGIHKALRLVHVHVHVDACTSPACNMCEAMKAEITPVEGVSHLDVICVEWGTIITSTVIHTTLNRILAAQIVALAWPFATQSHTCTYCSLVGDKKLLLKFCIKFVHACTCMHNVHCTCTCRICMYM